MSRRVRPVVTPRSRRAASVSVIAAVAALGLTACEKPSPTVTMVSGSDRVRVEADAGCYAHDEDATIDAASCDTDPGSAPELVLAGDGTLRIDVDPPLAENGWNAYVTVPGSAEEQAFFPTTRTDTYDQLSISEEAFSNGPLVVQVRELAADGTSLRGIWRFQLVGSQTD